MGAGQCSRGPGSGWGNNRHNPLGLRRGEKGDGSKNEKAKALASTLLAQAGDWDLHAHHSRVPASLGHSLRACFRFEEKSGKKKSQASGAKAWLCFTTLSTYKSM